MKQEEINEIADLHFPYFSQYMGLNLATLPEDRIPDLRLDEKTEDCYTDHMEIVLGLKMQFFNECKEEKDVDATIMYLMGHEMQHCLSSPDKAWKWGITYGTMELAKELSNQIEGPYARKICRPQDVETFCGDMRKKGYYITVSSLNQFCHGIQNSLEDGRIERIRSSKSRLFKTLTLAFRGRFWSECEVEEYGTNAGAKLTDILNQILLVSTVGAYEKGFVKYYDGTPEMALMESLLPDIGMGVWSPTCRQCMRHAVSAEKKLAKLFAETAKDEATLRSFLQKLAQQLSDGEGQTGEDSGRGVSLADEQEDTDEKANDTYNKLCKEAGDEDAKDTSSGNGKEDEKASNKNSASGSDENGKEEGKKASGKGSASEEDGADDKAAGSKGSDESDEGSSGNGNEPGKDGDKEGSTKGDKRGESGDGKSSDDKLPEITPGMLNSENGGTDSVVGKAGSGKGVDAAKIEKIIEEAMKAAAAQAVSIKEAAEAKVKKPSKDNSRPDTSKPWTESDDFKARHKDTKFSEKKRAYDIKDQLPAPLKAKADTFRKSVEKLYQKETTLYSMNRRSGRLNPNDAWMLKAGRSDVFMRKTENKERKYCVYILLDNSGSMGYGRYSKRDIACRQLAVIEEGFKDYVPMKIVAFDYNGVVIHEVIKGWDERYDRNCSWNYDLHGRGGGGNMDAYDIEIATEELNARPEEKKLLIVLSDGSPAEDTPGDVQKAVKRARKGGIEVASILFGNSLSGSEIEYFKKMYETNCVTTEPEKIIDELSRILKQFCFRK